MTASKNTPLGNPAREAIDSLRGYVYQIYQSALAWIDIKDDQFLFLEIAEDFAIAAATALQAVQVKETSDRVTINSDGIVASIDSFVELQEKNPTLNISLRHLTTSQIGKEKSPKHRIGEIPTLIAWRNLAKTGELSELRRIFENSKLSAKSKSFISTLSDEDLREKFLKKIHFDCGAPDSHFLLRQLSSRVSALLIRRGGVHSQAESCTASILLTLLKLSTNKNRDERFVDRSGLEEQLEAATQVSINRAQFEAQNRLIERALSASMSSNTDISNSRMGTPSLVSETPLPKALANRGNSIAQLQQALERAGICWISGAAGMGKTVAARVIAHKNKGRWASINLRSQSSEQVALALLQAAQEMPEVGLRGLILDDLDFASEPLVFDGLLYLVHSAIRSDVLLVCNSSSPPTSDFLFTSNLTADIAFTLTEFTEEDIKEILEKIGVRDAAWARYAYLVSGGGHPQLVTAFIQSMTLSGWNADEFRTFNALLIGSPEVNEVRKRTRERLLKDLPDSARRLIERLSLKAGGFSRELAIDLGNATPPIQDVGIVLDGIIGSWVDQLANDRFSLSPLLSDYAAKTLSSDESKRIQSAIADSLTKGNRFHVIDMNSALLAAWSSENKAVILKLCAAVFATDNAELELLATHLSMFTLFRTDKVAYPGDAVISHMFRGAQLVLLSQKSDSQSTFNDALRCFSEEAGNVRREMMRASTNLLVYLKLLIQPSRPALGVNFISIIRELAELLQNKNGVLPAAMLEGLEKHEVKGITTIGFLFLNQTHHLSKIEDLLTVFSFLDSCLPELRLQLLAPFAHDNFEIDMLVAGAWLSEYKNNTINPSSHCLVFSRLEKYAEGWSHSALAVCCRKYRAIILDEHGNDREGALAVLNEGLTIYGQTNSELVRAKAKVLYRSADHASSLALSKELIESDAPLNEIEKAFLGRDAAISAEKQGDFETARRYYLYGSHAASSSELPDMVAMRVGLLADAALASWHNGDRLTCLQDLVTVLSELNQFAPEETLRTTHCHAVVRHVLLWLDQDATGIPRLLENGEETKIYPGCVSNPEPHPEIKKQHITPIEIAWYLLAAVENHASLDAGITANIQRLLPKGPVLSGEMLLSPAKLHNAINQLNVKLFIAALTDTVSFFAFVQSSGEPFRALDIRKPTYGIFPLATNEQQEACKGLTEQFILLYFSMCILKEDVESIEVALQEISLSRGFAVRPSLLERLQIPGQTDDFYSDFAQLIRIHTNGLSGGQKVLPRQVFELAFKILQMAKTSGNYLLFSQSLVPWLVKRWQFIWECQRFLLISPSLYGATIEAALNREGVTPQVKVVDILSAILPTLGVSNQKELEKILFSLPKQ